MIKHDYQRPVYVVDGCRTPFLKARGRMGPFSAADLAVAAGRELLARQLFEPTELDSVTIGCVMPAPDEANIARIISLRLGCGKAVPAYTVQRNCASGMQALDSAAKDIACGRHELILAGGTEAMSHAPLLFSEAMVDWLADWYKAKSFGAKVRLITKFRPTFLAPVIALLKGLQDPIVGLSMGQTAENLVYRFHLTREQLDEFSMRSHHRVAAAQSAGRLKEIITLYDGQGQYYEADDGVRADNTLEQLAELKPFFDKTFGIVTAGNSSQVTDGAALLILASEEAVKKYNLPILGRLVDTQWAGVEPEEMGLGPVFATTHLMKRNNITFKDIDYIEINEAFAAQVLGCLAAWEDEEYCKTRLGLEHALGQLDQAKLNVDGGAIAIGHPLGASGARIVLHLLNTLKSRQATHGLATICIGGGQGGAMLVENV